MGRRRGMEKEKKGNYHVHYISVAWDLFILPITLCLAYSSGGVVVGANKMMVIGASFVSFFLRWAGCGQMFPPFIHTSHIYTRS